MDITWQHRKQAQKIIIDLLQVASRREIKERLRLKNENYVSFAAENKRNFREVYPLPPSQVELILGWAADQ